MPYTHTTLGQLKTQVASRLGDTGNVYWSVPELQMHITEALRTWGLLTGYWIDRGLFTTTSGTAFYNINTLVNGAASPLLSSVATDRELVIAAQYNLLEPATAGGTWTGSEQFTLEDVAKAIFRRRDQLLAETACTLSITNNLAATSPYFDAPTTTIDIRRLSFKGTTSGTYYEITPEGIERQRAYANDFLLQQGTPATYSIDSHSPLSLRIAPLLPEPGVFNMISVETGGTIDPANGVNVLGIPDNMVWILKWGMLADLLGRDGPGRDMPRAYFCERRYQLGVILAKTMPTVLAAELNGLPIKPTTLSEIDAYFGASWETTPAAPQVIGTSRNIVAIAPRPDGIYSVNLDVVRKAVVPSADGDYIQVGKEEMNAITDYVVHLAAFKMGGMEFQSTYRMADNFFDAALRYNERIAAHSPAIRDVVKQSVEDFFRRPYLRDGGTGTLLEPVERVQ